MGYCLERKLKKLNITSVEGSETMVRGLSAFIPSVLVILTGLCAVPMGALAQSSGDAMRGAALADSWCQSCHIIDKQGTGRAIDPAPPFPLIANDPKKTPGYLLQWLSSSHPQMPNFNLGRREIEDLIAYIRSLAVPREPQPKSGQRRLKERRGA